MISETIEFKNLETSLKNDELPISILINSPDRETNEIFIKEFCKMFFCASHSICEKCEGCVQTTLGTNPDLIVLPSGESFQVLDAEFVVENVYLTPMTYQRKIFYIKNFDKSTEAAQNKILKILEEPPKSVVFVISTTNTSKILPTILSRCNVINLLPLSLDQIKSYFTKYDERELNKAYSFSDGYIGKMRLFLENKNFSDANLLAENIINNLKSSKEIILYSSQISKNKDFFLAVIELLEKEYAKLFNKQILNNLCVVEIINLLNNAKSEVEKNVSIQIVADNLLMKILETKYLYK